jgi:ABC-type uncharacterized transport system substrate-binding protein
MSSRIKTLVHTGCLVCLMLAGCGRSARQAENPAETAARAIDSSREGTAARGYRVLHIMSYHSPWEWTDDLLRGFQDALAGLPVEYKVFQMDTKRNSTPEWKLAVGEKARNLIETWQPDLVYTSDDNAQEYVARYYVDQDLPFVFSAVNVDPAEYGFVGSSNITGVLEQEHFVETVGLLREIVPSVMRIAVIVDDDPTWTGVVARMKEKAATLLTDMEFIGWDTITTFEEYRRKIREYQSRADALALLGVHTFKDENGRNLPWQDVLRWTAENSMLPDFSFWKDRVPYGTLCVVYVSGYEQGLAAGKIARGILAEGKSPSSYPMKPTIKGQPIISLARARKIGVQVKSSILLTAKVVERFAWEE